MSKVNRRKFLHLLLGSATLAALSRCAPGKPVPGRPVPSSPTPTTSPDSTDEAPRPTATTPAPATTPVPTATPPVTTATPEVLRNENREGAYVRYYNPFPPVDPEAWTLSVGGKVRHPQRLSLKDVLAIPKVAQSSRMKCVEGWSFPAKWEGFRPQELVDRVKPYEDATWVHFYCADDYYESLPLGDLLLDRVLFAYGMNDARLEPAYGAPLRLIVPFKYGYKGPKAITRIEFATEELRGYWSTVGPYSTEGDVQPGWDHALDLDDFRQVEGWGEIVYEDGIEAQEE